MGRIPTDFIERCYAGWLGKIIGVRHGAPIEGWSYERILSVLGEIDGYPVDYRDFAADDDSNGPMFFLRALRDYTASRELTAEQVGLTWLNYAPYEHGFYWWGGYGRSTEHTAYLNLRAGIMAPRSGSVEQNGAAVAEQIGGQIFIDTWGLVAPADPALAAEFAEKAASVGHGGNGVYGGQFIAAAISAAFTAGDVHEVIAQALAQIPEDCEYARMTRDILAFHEAHRAGDWRECFAHIKANWGYDRYPGACHIIPNSAVIVMSLLYGADSFDRAINICNMAGWDTDCNVANVGTIMGVLKGLGAIDYAKWRAPINDFLACSSVVGCLNIMDLPNCVREIARLAYLIAGEDCPDAWRPFLKEDAPRFDFALPGSTYAMRVKGASEPVVIQCGIAPQGGMGSLKFTELSAKPETAVKLYQRTYYRPEDFHDSRYDPAFSPTLYPGQRVTACLMGDEEGAQVSVCLYAHDANADKDYEGESVVLRPGEWTQLTLDIPAIDGGLITEAGVKLVAQPKGYHAIMSAYLGWMEFSGTPDYTLDFSRERMEVWHGLHREVSQMTYLKGIWALEEGRLCASCADFGEAYTGDIAWRDYEVECAFTPMTEGLCGFTFRTQGAIRGYSLAVSEGALVLSKNDNGYRTLASVPMVWEAGRRYVLNARLTGNRIEVLSGGEVLMDYTDGDEPYLSGMVGLRVERGARCGFDYLKVKGFGE